MTAFIYKILEWLGGGVLTSLLQTYLKSRDIDLERLKTTVGADRDVILAQITAQVEAQRSRVDMLKGMKVTQWLITAALVPPLYHQALVFLDSCPWFLFWPHEQGSWKVAALPGAYADHEWLMISSLLCIQTVKASALGALRYLHK